jgi:signal transduction histidine kinase
VQPELLAGSPWSSQTDTALRREACATAVAHDRERIAEDLYDTVIHRLFAAGLQLQATCQTVDGATQARLEGTIDLLDTTITELRKAIFSLH